MSSVLLVFFFRFVLGPKTKQKKFSPCRRSLEYAEYITCRRLRHLHKGGGDL